jgi:hypothetical protein
MITAVNHPIWFITLCVTTGLALGALTALTADLINHHRTHTTHQGDAPCPDSASNASTKTA